MRSLRKLPRTLALAAVTLLSACSNGVFGNPQYLAVTVTPRPGSLPSGGTLTLSASVTNNLSVPTWSILNAANAASAGPRPP